MEVDQRRIMGGGGRVSNYIGKGSHVTPNIDSLDGTELLSRQVMETNYD